MSNDEWMTPPELFQKLNAEFHFGLDVACSEYNCLCREGLVFPKFSALTADDWWMYILPENEACWMNPPYSKPNLDLFCKKALEESKRGCVVVALLPDDCSTGWYQKYVFGVAHKVRQLTKRVRHIDPVTGKPGGSPKFGSLIVVWRPGIPEYTKFSLYSF